MRIIDKDATFHIGHRGSGIQPRTLEIYNYLGILPDFLQKGSLHVPRCIYEMPGGRKPIKIVDIAAHEDPRPSTPFVCISLAHEELRLILTVEKSLHHWTRS